MHNDTVSATPNGPPSGPPSGYNVVRKATVSGGRSDRINILIVDDEPKNLTVLETVLDDPDYRLVRAESADEALLALVGEEFALLILDVRMPGMTGFELALMVKERKKTSRIPIIFLTAYYNEDQHALEGYGSGAVDYLLKPVNPAILRSKVAVFAELHRRGQESTLANRALLAEVAGRRKAEETLRQLTETLEQRVVERTEALRQAHEKLEGVMSSITDGLMVLDKNWRFTYVNEQGARMMGRRTEELVGASFWQLFPHATTSSFFENYHHAIQSGESVHFEECYPEPLNKWFECHGYPSDEGLTVYFHDVTERKRAQSGLHESEQRFRVMADETPVMMWVTDASGGIEFVNREYCRFFGLPPEEALDVNWRPHVHPEDSAYVEAFVESSRSHTPFHAQARMRRADGTWRWMSSYGAPRSSPADEFMGMIVTSQDVTDQKEAADIQQQAAREKDEFIAVLAHELRNPLAPIRTSIGVLRAGGSSDPVLVRCADVIDRQTTHMARLLDDLLDISRLSRNRLTLQRTRVVLNDVIAAAIEITRPLIDQHGHQLTVDGLDQPILLEADAARLTQVFGNLLNNAAKYSQPGSRIQLSVRRKDGWTDVAVRDEGIGIAADMVDRIFELFIQGHASSDHAAGGLGIGLSLAHRLAEMHGGAIHVASAGPGQGSEFTVRLPMTDVDDGATVAVVDATPRTVQLRHRVLVVDDNVDAADMTAALLGALGCEVRTAYDGEAAIREAELFRPDLLLLDIGMPRVDGYDACARIRSQPWGAEMVVVAVTGWGQEADRRLSVSAGFDRHLVKPVDPAMLVQLVGDLRPRRA